MVKKISIILPVEKKNAWNIYKLLNSINKQLYEIIIVSDEEIDKKEKHIKYFINKQGKNACINKGIEESSKKYILLLDQDMIISNELEEEIQKHIKNNFNVCKIPEEINSHKGNNFKKALNLEKELACLDPYVFSPRLFKKSTYIKEIKKIPEDIDPIDDGYINDKINFKKIKFKTLNKKIKINIKEENILKFLHTRSKAKYKRGIVQKNYKNYFESNQFKLRIRIRLIISNFNKVQKKYSIINKILYLNIKLLDLIFFKIGSLKK